MNDIPSPVRGKLPPWLKRRLRVGSEGGEVQRLLASLNLPTVCTHAHCPNQAECYSRRTATFLILGSRCTRSCPFCAVSPAGPGELHPPDPREAQAVAEAAARLGLRHVVITSVTRDDLADGGAAHFAATIRAVRIRLPEAAVEVLTPDFLGKASSLDAVLDARPDVFNHNLETVPRLYRAIRPQADYTRSLDVLAHAGRRAAEPGTRVWTKSGLMAGMGETAEEIGQVLRDLRAVQCDIVTIGQYLCPSRRHAPVVRYVPPEEFAAWEVQARAIGFAAVAAGPFVRSSYQAAEVFQSRQDRHR